MKSDDGTNRAKKLFSLIYICSVIYLLAVSWRRWTSPIADSGREMDLPLRLLRGELLYRDVHYLYPPLSPYFNAQLYRLFGAHLDTLLAGGIAFCGLLIYLSYRIARRLLSPAEALIAALAVTVWCIFKPAGNLISPYSFAALHGTVLALSVLLFTLRYSENRRARELIIAGLLIGLAAITKQEFALAGAATVTAGLVFIHRNNRSTPGKFIADLSFAALPAALIALPVYALLFKLIGWETLVRDCHLFYTDLPASLVFYNSHRTGLDRPLFSLLQMLGAAAVGVAALATIVLVSDRKRIVFRRASLILSVSTLAVFTVKLIAGTQWDGSPLRALPLFLLATIIAVWLGNERSSAALFIISAYSLAILARVSLRVPSGGAFGGFFLPASLVLACYLFLRFLPESIERWTLDPAGFKRARSIGQGLLIAMLIVTAIVFGVRFRRTFNYEVTAERGRFYAPRSSGKELESALRFIEKKTLPDEAIAVLPEGSDLAFLTGRRMPLRHQILIPGLMKDKDELEAIEKLKEERVRYILIVNRPMREFGAEAFGRDFYTTLGRWIDLNYRVVEVFGATEDAQIGAPRFFIKVLEKID